MYVELLASTGPSWMLSRWVERIVPESEDGTWPDYLGEFAGRECYRSLNRPNPKTASNDLYLNHIIESGHFSVLEHASATFSVSDVSRHLLGELTRHRHLSFSVESLRYCAPREATIHPTVQEYGYQEAMKQHFSTCLKMYEQVYADLTFRGLPKKQVAEAAAQFLPLSTATDLVVTGNFRAWRDVLNKRLDPTANREIRQLADFILTELKKVGPNSFQDFEDGVLDV